LVFFVQNMIKSNPVLNAEFVKSSSMFSQSPQNGVPEFAFIGRSNVGKSSLINYLTGRKKLAKTSSTPGKTQLINHFLIESEFYLVDLPGYGYAKVSKKKKSKFQGLITEFLEASKDLVCLFVLIDSRLEPQKIDLEFLEYLGLKNIPFVLIFTKTDKLASHKVEKNISSFKNALLQKWESHPQIFKSSSTKKTGREEILSFVKECMP
jgi:GTP-binding protein